jgi:hypothetical protein
MLAPRNGRGLGWPSGRAGVVGCINLRSDLSPLPRFGFEPETPDRIGGGLCFLQALVGFSEIPSYHAPFMRTDLVTGLSHIAHREPASLWVAKLLGRQVSAPEP